jgi:ribonuclease HI
MKISVYVDANPKMTAFVADDGRSGVGPIEEKVTNNQAEYIAVIRALHIFKDYDYMEILSDSELVVKQLNHEWNIKDDNLRHYAVEAWGLCHGRTVIFKYVSRKDNPAGRLLG